MPLFIIYIVFSSLLWPLSIPFLYLFRKPRKRLIHQWQLFLKAWKIISSKKSDKEVVVLHAASSGEFEQLKPILPKIDKKRYVILQTCFSPTVYKSISENPYPDAVCYHPLDSLLSAFLFILLFRPAKYISTRHDLWPSHLAAAGILDTDTYLINANMHKNTFRKHPLLFSFNRVLLNRLTAIYCGSARLKSNIEDYNTSTDIYVTGDTRFDRVIERSRDLQPDLLPEDFKHTENIVLGSIVPSDYEIVFQGISEFMKQAPSLSSELRIIAVPHEVDKKSVLALEKKLKKYNLEYSKYSKGDFTKRVIIVDRTGILTDLYAWGALAYVGAGFAGGVHSVLEPAVHGCATSFGPNYDLLDEAVAMVQKDLVGIIRSSADFADFISLLGEKNKLVRLQTDIRDFIINKPRVSDKIVESIF